mmetsp:Transcript_123654/g.395589  ORF Transcript_123654/g.395589 Transcript_123654/m.395589 type:complete len:545 (-) Transcript_123654:393-2027(-)
MMRSDSETEGRRAEISHPLADWAGGSGVADEAGGAAVAGPSAWRRYPECIGGLCSGPLKVRLILWAQYFGTTGTEISLGALFDAYLLIRLGSNSAVGSIESIRGMTTLLCAIPLGWAIDVWPRSQVLRYNVIGGLVAAACLLFGFPSDAMWLIVCGCVITSVHNQCLYGIFPVLLKEASADGADNAAAQSNSQTASSLGRASGPFLQLLLIWMTGNENWSASELHWILLAGLVFFALYIPFVCRVAAIGSPSADGEEEPTSAASPSPSSSFSSSSSAAVETPRWHWIIAGMCELSSVITAIGSGMTFKYWTLFFKQDFGFSPAGVCVMNFVIWLAIAASNQLFQPLVRRLGRLPMANAFHVSGTALLFLISNQSLGPAIEVPLVIVRNALMNSGGPLVQSLILELVPSKHRGKWSSLASLRRMTWSGSAFIGGLLSDKHDYRYAFFITACVHSVAGSLLLLVNLLLWMRPVDKPNMTSGSPVAGAHPCASAAAELGPVVAAAATHAAGRGRGAGGWPEALDARHGLGGAPTTNGVSGDLGPKSH